MSMLHEKNREKLVEQVLAGTALATLLGYLGLAWAILRKERRPVCRRQ